MSEALQNLFLSPKELIYAACQVSTETDNQVNKFEALQNFFLSEAELMYIGAVTRAGTEGQVPCP